MRIPFYDKSFFDEWMVFHKKFIFEKNWEIWKQFHITLSTDMVIFVVDGRYPEFFYEIDVESFNENILLLVNKSDLISYEEMTKIEETFPNKKIIFYSTKLNLSFPKYKNNKIMSSLSLLKYLKDTNIENIGIV